MALMGVPQDQLLGDRINHALENIGVSLTRMRDELLGYPNGKDQKCLRSEYEPLSQQNPDELHEAHPLASVEADGSPDSDATVGSKSPRRNQRVIQSPSVSPYSYSPATPPEAFRFWP